MNYYQLFSQLVKIALVLSFLNGFANAQSIEKKSLELRLGTGFTKVQPYELNAFFEQRVELYRRRGIPIPIQRQFTGNIIYEISLMYGINSKLLIGFGVNHFKTKAYSLYTDRFGTFDAIGQISQLSLNGIFELKPLQTRSWNLFFVIAGGYRIIESGITEKVRLKRFAQDNFDYVLSNHTGAFGMEGFTGFQYIFSRFAPFVKLGYRFLGASQVQSKEQNNNFAPRIRKMNLEHDLSGIVIKAGLGIFVF